MLYRSVLTTAVALVGLTLAAPSCSTDSEATCKKSALSIVRGRCNNNLLPFGCLNDLTNQAKSFCSTYLTPSTISKTASTTKTLVVSLTKTDTATTTATEVTTSTTTDIVVATDLATTTETVFTDTTTSTVTNFVDPSSFPAIRRRFWPTGCPDLNTAAITNLGPAKASSLCSFLGVKPRTTTVTSTKTATSTVSTTAATATATTIVTATVVTVETALTQTTTTVVTTTTTSDVALATVSIDDYCGPSNSFAPSGQGGQLSNLLVAGPTTSAECCRECWTGLNCIGSTVYRGNCYHFIFTGSGGPITGHCPSGRGTPNLFAPGPGIYQKGPCAPPV